MLGAVPLLTTGCHTAAETAGLVAGATATGAISPANEIEQVYYVGTFDPEEQLPPQVYRLRVHGQSSAISGDSFASGWVPAKLIDSLSGRVTLDPYGGSGPVITGPSSADEVNLNVGRRMWMFGPEGFRVAPADYRLAIVMSADPSKYFDAMDQMLGISTLASTGQSGGGNSQVQTDLLDSYRAILNSREQLQKVQQQVPANNP
jgi:hypothetical protein